MDAHIIVLDPILLGQVFSAVFAVPCKIASRTEPVEPVFLAATGTASVLSPVCNHSVVDGGAVPLEYNAAAALAVSMLFAVDTVLFESVLAGKMIVAGFVVNFCRCELTCLPLFCSGVGVIPVSLSPPKGPVYVYDISRAELRSGELMTEVELTVSC